MAPTIAASANRKRSRPAFSPPRPKGARPNGVSKPKPKSAQSTKKSNIGSVFAESSRKSKTKPKPTKKAQRKQVVIDEAEDDEDEDDEEQEEENSDDAGEEAADEDDEANSNADLEIARRLIDSSPPSSMSEAEPEYILAEVTTDTPSSNEPAIPLPLLHRLLHHSFTKPDSTRLSSDARAAVGKYVETFVREGIARCAFEVGEKRDSNSDSGIGTKDDGWLEVDDLERVGGQLVLDF